MENNTVCLTESHGEHKSNSNKSSRHKYIDTFIQDELSLFNEIIMT